MEGQGRKHNALRVRHVHCENRLSLVVVSISFPMGFCCPPWIDFITACALGTISVECY